MRTSSFRVALFALALPSAACGGDDEGFVHSFGRGELEITSVPTVVDADGQPPAHAFAGFFMTIEQNAPNVSPSSEKTEISISGDGPFAGVFPRGTLIVKLHAEPTTGTPLELTSFPGDPDVGEGKLLYASNEGDTATASGVLVVERHAFSPETDGENARLSVKISFDAVELGGNGVPPYTVDGVLELSGVDSNPKEELPEEGSGSTGGRFLLTCHDRATGVCIEYTTEHEADRDSLRSQCGASFVGLDHRCPGGAGYCRHECGVPGQPDCTNTSLSRTSDTYDYQLDSATLRQLCVETNGTWHG